MFKPYLVMLQKLSSVYTADTVEQLLLSFGLKIPADVNLFYLGGEPCEYILAAALACSQTGD